MMPRLVPCTALVLSGAFVFHAVVGMGAWAEETHDIYRANTPKVLVPDGNADDDRGAEIPSAEARLAFQRAYRRAGAPRLAVFWNRVFDDRLREMEAESRLVFKGNRVGQAGDASGLSHERGEWTVSIEKRQDHVRPQTLSGKSGFRFQSGFLRPLIEAGATVIDRAAIMRLTAAEQSLVEPARSTEDRQFVETSALMGRADLLIQIAVSPFEDSKTPAFLHVSIIHVKSGQVKANFFHEATPEYEGRQTWKAVSGGYVQVTQSPDFERMGRILAALTMDALANLESI